MPTVPTYSLLTPPSPVPVGGSAKRVAFGGMTTVARAESKGEYGRQEAQWDYVARCVPPIFPSHAVAPHTSFRHTLTCTWPWSTTTVWRNLEQNLQHAPILYSSFIIHHSSLSYTFSAKEKDVETGLSYFGSRYYSSNLSIWLSVDPQSDKYASLSPYVYCADNPVRLVDPNGEDWFENELTGDVYYNRDYRKGDEKSLEGKGWKWMGANNMFEKSDDAAINSNLDKVSVVSCRQDGVDGIANATFKGENAEAFMNNMGYEKRPLVQDVEVRSITQTFPDAMGPNSFSHTETSESVVKTFSWTYAQNTSASRYSVLSRKNVKDNFIIFAATHIYTATERRKYDYSMPSRTQTFISIINEVAEGVSKLF